MLKSGELRVTQRARHSHAHETREMFAATLATSFNVAATDFGETDAVTLGFWLKPDGWGGAADHAGADPRGNRPKFAKISPRCSGARPLHAARK